MGNFINTTHKDVLNTFTSVKKEIIKNPYYLFNDQKATPVEYHHTNKNMSTLDESLYINYSDLGENSPYRYDVIHDFYLYGLDKMIISLENTEFGMESSEITGEASILPNTIEPYTTDFFKFYPKNEKDKAYLFKIIEVQSDTLNNGANMWKVTYKLERTDYGDLDKQTVAEFSFLPKNLGTDFNPIIKKDTYELSKKLDDISVLLKDYYRNLFFNDKVQTFTFNTYLGTNNFYDPFMIEFLIRNQILNNTGSKYLYVQHQLPISRTFSIDYSKTLYRAIELKDINAFCECKLETDASYIEDRLSIFSTRTESYFKLNHSVHFYEPASKVIEMLPNDLGLRIKDYDLYNEPSISHLNILIKYFNNVKLSYEDIESLEGIIYEDCNINLFFVIPILIFCIESDLKSYLSINS